MTIRSRGMSTIRVTDGDLPAAMAWVIAQNRPYDVELEANRTYEVDSTIVMNKLRTIRVRGESPVSNDTTNGAAKIHFTALDQPCFALQWTRGCEFRDLVFIGENTLPVDFADTMLTDATFLTDGVRDNRYSPHCAIAFDPFGGPTTLAANRYPGLSAQYEIGAHDFVGGTSEAIIRRCVFTGWNVCIANGLSGNPSMLQGDFITAERCYFKSNRVAWAGGQHQSKGCAIVDSVIYGAQYAIDTARYGIKAGWPPNMRGGFVGGVPRAFNIVQNYGCFGVTDVQMEQLQSLGCIGWGVSSVTKSAMFTNCDVSFWDGLDGDSDAHLISTRDVIFNGGSLAMGDPSLNSNVMRFVNHGQLTFNNVAIGSYYDGDPPMSFETPSLVNMSKCLALDTVLGKQRLNFTSNSYTTNAIASVTVTASGVRSATFTSAGHGLLVGDKVYADGLTFLPKQHRDAPHDDGAGGVAGDDDGNGNTATSSPNSILGRVTAVNGNDVTIGGVPEGLRVMLPTTMSLNKRTLDS